MGLPILRDYQAQGHVEVRQAWQQLGPKSNVLRILPTGGGKSVEVAYEVATSDTEGYLQCVIAHRQELVGQMSLHIARTGVKHRIIGPDNVISNITADHRREFGKSFVDPKARCSVAGVDTLVSRKKQLATWGAQVGKWVTDEAHHVLRDNKWGSAIELFPNAYGLGVTAYEKRADGMGVGRSADGVFDRMVIGPNMRDLIRMGSLTDYELVIPETDFDRDSLKITGTGDFSPKGMKEASEKSRIVGSVLQHYCVHALGKQAIVFVTDVATSNKTAAQFNAIGIPAASVSALTEDSVRQEYIRRFRAGTIKVLVNVDLFGEGFDLPAIEVVIMARPTMSRSIYLQQFGRALRLLEGKKYGLIIDLVSNFKQHGFPDKPREYSMDRRDKRGKQTPDPEEIELQRCTNKLCMRAFDGAAKVCPYCATEVPKLLPGLGGVRDLKQVDGDLTLLTADILEKMRGDIVLPSFAQVANATAFATGSAGIGQFKANQHMEKVDAQRQLQETLDLWAGYRVAAGDEIDTVYRRFYLTVGKSVLDVQHKDLTKAEYDKTREMVQSWMR